MINFLNRRSFAQKIGAAFTVMIALLAGVSVILMMGLRTLNANAEHVRTNVLPSMAVLGELTGSIQRYRVGNAMYALARTSEERTEARQNMQGRLDELLAVRARYEPMIAKGTEDETLIRRFDEALTSYRADVTAQMAAGGDLRSFFSTEAVASFLKVRNLLQENVALHVHAGEQAAESGRATYVRSLWIAAAAIAVAAIASLALVGGLIVNVSRPVRRLTNVMGNLAAQDLDVEIVGAARQDEIGGMARSVAVLRDKLRDARRMEGEAMAEREAKERRAARLNERMQTFELKATSLVAQVSAASSEMHATARSMSATAARTDTQASSVASAAGEASAAVQTVAAAAEELSASISEITRQVSQSARISERAVDDARRTDGIVQALAEGADKIGKVVDLISVIAGQTNLLALNATIEAARAGDAGKGFAVVASEVKGLASQTARATEEIGQQITQIQSITAEAVAAIRAIAGTIEEVSAIGSSIAAAVEQQGAATSEIARNVQQTAQATQHVTSTISGVSDSATEAGAASTQVLGAADSLSRQAEELTQEVGQFLSDVRAA